MEKAACDILRPDGSVIKKGTVLSDDLVFEFERSSPHLLDCYVTQNSRYLKKIKDKLVPHYKVLEQDLVEIKHAPSKKKEEKIFNLEDMSKEDLDKYAENKGIKLDRRKSKEEMIKDFKKAK